MFAFNIWLIWNPVGLTSDSSLYLWLEDHLIQVRAASSSDTWDNEWLCCQMVSNYACCVCFQRPSTHYHSAVQSPPHTSVYSVTVKDRWSQKQVTLWVLLMPKHTLSEYLTTIQNRTYPCPQLTSRHLSFIIKTHFWRKKKKFHENEPTVEIRFKCLKWYLVINILMENMVLTDCLINAHTASWRVYFIHTGTESTVVHQE